ncbi:hypothetical protein H5410_022986 [Solanum commersonii]|uniref:Uncharacterized protein n=1 Tax=Solanum commersonii TaxID=4109 RepID=A0A9J5ZFL3_SOLCO|nr:hypothetical protein H5410_022986 [Solanum commersonii]
MGSQPYACPTVSARSEPRKGTSIWGSLRGATTFASSRMRLISKVPVGWINLSQCQIDTPESLHNWKIKHGKGMQAKSISTPATSVGTMITLSHMSWLSAFVGDTLLRTNNQKNLATKFKVAFRIPNRGTAIHSACSPSAAMVSSHPITLVKVKKPVNVRDSVQAPSEESALLCNKLGHLSFVISHLGIPINLPLALNTPSVCSPATRVGSSFLVAGTDSELVASSDEAAWSF